MKKTTLVTVGFLIVALVSLPVVADAHWGGGGLFLGFGAGLLTGYLLAPSPVYVAPPVYAAPPPPVYYPSYVPAPAPPPAPPVSEYSNRTSEAVPPPASESKCREWRLIERRLVDRWDSYSGRWQSIPVEKWGWVEVPCSN
jgi:hypothetical protein